MSARTHHVVGTLVGLVTLGAVSVAAAAQQRYISATTADCFTYPARARYCLIQDGGIGLLRSGTSTQSVIWVWLDDNGVPHVTRGDAR